MAKALLAAGSAAARPLAAFFDWWRAELAGVLPAGLRAAFSGARRELLITLDADQVALTAVRRGAREPIGRYPRAGGGDAQGAPLGALGQAEAVILCLPEDDVLVRAVRLPLATEVNLRGVLGYMMERNTPFSAEQVYYDFRLLARDTERRELEVELCVAPRETVDRALAAVAALGLHPDRVSVCGEDEPGYRPVSLLPGRRRRRRGRALRLLNGLLSLLALALLVAVLALPRWQKWERLQALEAELAGAQESAAEARRLREGIDRLAGADAFLAEKRRSTPLVLALMGEVTSLLPDDTWLSHLSIQGGQVQMRGFSAASAALIPIVESSLLLGGASFRSPVVRDVVSGSERFDLAARIESGRPR